MFLLAIPAAGLLSTLAEVALVNFVAVLVQKTTADAYDRVVHGDQSQSAS